MEDKSSRMVLQVYGLSKHSQDLCNVDYQHGIRSEIE